MKITKIEAVRVTGIIFEYEGLLSVHNTVRTPRNNLINLFKSYLITY